MWSKLAQRKSAPEGELTAVAANAFRSGRRWPRWIAIVSSTVPVAAAIVALAWSTWARACSVPPKLPRGLTRSPLADGNLLAVDVDLAIDVCGAAPDAPGPLAPVEPVPNPR